MHYTKWICVVCALMAFSCSNSHVVENDAGFDSGSIEIDAALDGNLGDTAVLDADLPDGLAPPCPALPPPPCFHAATHISFEAHEPNSGDMMLTGSLHGFAYADGPAVLYQHAFPEDGPDVPPESMRPGSPVRWALIRWSASGDNLGPPSFLDDAFDTQFVGSAGDLTAVDGQLVAAWRQTRFDNPSYPRAATGFTSFVRVGSGPVVALEEVSERFYTRRGAGVVAGGGMVFTTEADGMVVRLQDGSPSRFLLETPDPPELPMAAAAVGDQGAIVAWSARAAGVVGGRLGVDAALVMPAGVQARARVFDANIGGSLESVDVLGFAGTVWIARYDVDARDLRQSRLRVAHLDNTLHRIEPDRWFGGWGGLSPEGLALVTFHDRPWLIWRTVDARYGANTVLYARPLQETACGYEVAQPLAISPPGNRVTQLLAAASDGAIWIATQGRLDLGTVEIDEFRSCD